ncbi:hypothetical protein [Mangrovibacterium lignilyticum]|uniref:hypothetical protein n=1 Tax=Mangrovibacterium lignilyticum TaxID=2668052 RepID=UPI0013D75280|nr:hypothetical protein [Mangrovibacterium lignilyticum]
MGKETSCVINSSASFIPNASIIYVSLMLWRKSGEKWSDDDLFPIKSIEFNEKTDQAIVNFKKIAQVVTAY